jgi:hypothetical protein
LCSSSVLGYLPWVKFLVSSMQPSWEEEQSLGVVVTGKKLGQWKHNLEVDIGIPHSTLSLKSPDTMGDEVFCTI